MWNVKKQCTCATHGLIEKLQTLPFIKDYECNWDYLMSPIFDLTKSWTNFLSIVEHFEGSLLSWEEHWGQSNVHPSFIWWVEIKSQVSFFNVLMLANFVAMMKRLLNYNPCFRMWALLIINQIIYFKLSKWPKLVESSMATGSIHNWGIKLSV